jgi:hypothetical protein
LRPICSRPPAKAAKGAPVATKVVHFSDLSGREAEDEGQLGRLVVLEHPDIGEPATLEVFPDEVSDLQSAERLVRLEYYAPSRYVFGIRTLSSTRSLRSMSGYRARLRPSYRYGASGPWCPTRRNDGLSSRCCAEVPVGQHDSGSVRPVYYAKPGTPASRTQLSHLPGNVFDQVL